VTVKRVAGKTRDGQNAFFTSLAAGDQPHLVSEFIRLMRFALREAPRDRFVQAVNFILVVLLLVDRALVELARWYNQVADSEFKSFNTIAATA
jgi:hypothetical protein